MVIPPSFTWEHCTSSSSCYTSSTVLHCVPTTATRRGWLVRFRATHWVAMTDGTITELDEVVPCFCERFIFLLSFHVLWVDCHYITTRLWLWSWGFIVWIAHSLWWFWVVVWLWFVPLDSRVFSAIISLAHWWCPPKLKCIASPHTAHSGVQQKWSSPHAMQRVPEPMF